MPVEKMVRAVAVIRMYEEKSGKHLIKAKQYAEKVIELAKGVICLLDEDCYALHMDDRESDPNDVLEELSRAVNETRRHVERFLSLYDVVAAVEDGKLDETEP